MFGHRRFAGAALLIALVCSAAVASGQESPRGTISFPNSGSPAAQPYFIDGVKLLHSFEWEDAADAFRKAEEADPAFAMAYWGEALSYTGGHHYPPDQDSAAGQKALARLASTPAARLAKAPTERERGYLSAVEKLYGDGDIHQRSLAYAEAMGALSARLPDDDEAATLYALALMRTERRGQQSLHVDMQAGAIALRVFRKNGNHPGAVHYIIHAFDEPSRAIIGLEAADIYAGLAPDAPHALHMPSHIYVQLGQWDKLSVANTASYEASARRSDRKHLHAIEPHAFHAMFWLHYAYLMQGNFAKADEALALGARHAKDIPPGPRSGQFEVMQARHVIETARWRKVDVASLVARIKAAAKDLNARVASSELLAAAMSAARLQDPAASEFAAGGLRDLAALSKSRGVVETKQLEIMAFEATGMALLARGDRTKAVEALQRAATIEESMDPPSGPPGEQETDPPIKPAHELLGEVLLEIGRPADAAKQFAIGLGRTPNRPRLLLGAAQAAVRTDDRATARLRYRQLLDLPGGGPDRPGLDEARASLGSASSRGQ
jgi:tetratricopeptide (TPR) repeat protein